MRISDWSSDVCSSDLYQGGVGKMLAAPLRWLGVFVAMVAVTALLFTRLPGSFLPQEDQGYLVTVIPAPPGAKPLRTNEEPKQATALSAAHPTDSNLVPVTVLGTTARWT